LEAAGTPSATHACSISTTTAATNTSSTTPPTTTSSSSTTTTTTTSSSSGSEPPWDGDPRHITLQLKHATTIPHLHAWLRRYDTHLNATNIAAAFKLAGQLCKAQQQQRSGGSGARAGAAPADARALLDQLRGRVTPLVSTLGAWEASEILWGCARARYVEPALLDACLARVADSAADVAPRYVLATAVWSAAQLSRCGYACDKDRCLAIVESLAQWHTACKPLDIANAMWAAATLELQVPLERMQQLVRGVLDDDEQEHGPQPQGVASALWMAAKMRIRLSEDLGQQLAAAVVRRRADATAQNLCNTMWAAATMGIQLPPSLWAQLLRALGGKLTEDRIAQGVANALWAVAKQLGSRKSADREVYAAVLELCNAVSSTQQIVAEMDAQNVSNMLWAMSQLGLRPEPLTQQLAEVAAKQAAGMIAQALSSTAMALAKLGVNDAHVFEALVMAAGRRELNMQALCNLCWAVAVVDQRQLVGAVLALCRRVAEPQQWERVVLHGRKQLYFVHIWLTDLQACGGSAGSGGGNIGLAAVLSPDQLDQCAAAWATNTLSTSPPSTLLHKRVLRCCVEELGAVLSGCQEEARTADGAFRMDVLAVHSATGQRVAIEADGPSHFLRPCGRPRGDTAARDRALAARGYVVVSVPHWEWDGMRVGDRGGYLRRRIEAALRSAAKH